MSLKNISLKDENERKKNFNLLLLEALIYLSYFLNPIERHEDHIRQWRAA